MDLDRLVIEMEEVYRQECVGLFSIGLIYMALQTLRISLSTASAKSARSPSHSGVASESLSPS